MGDDVLMNSKYVLVVTYHNAVSLAARSSSVHSAVSDDIIGIGSRGTPGAGAPL